VNVSQFRIRDLGVVVVTATAGRTISREMLRPGQNALRSEVALETPHMRGRNGGSQVRILAGAFDNASPARVAGDIDHRSEGPLDAGRACFGGRGGLRGFYA